MHFLVLIPSEEAYTPVMQIPRQLQVLVEDGLIEAVVRPLMSGKEASVLVVISEGQVRCAKVYKEANQRNFRQRAGYEETRRTRNSRSARAMGRRSRFGKQELEAAWQTTEVDTMHRLAHAGVRVPTPHVFAEGVLIMDLVVDAEGNAAPRLNDVSLTPERAREYHAFMLSQIVRMLCAGLIHGDLSEYNVLVGVDGPVLIDFPQAVDAAANNSAKTFLLRDVANMAAYFGQFAPELKKTQYGKEIWKQYERGELDVDGTLTGLFEESKAEVDVTGVMRDITDAKEEHERRTGRTVVDVSPAPGSEDTGTEGGHQPGRGRGGGNGTQGASSPSHARDPQANPAPGNSKRRRRRRGRGRGDAPGNAQQNASSAGASTQRGRAGSENSPPSRPNSPPSRPNSPPSRPEGPARAPQNAGTGQGSPGGEDAGPPRRRRRRRRRKPPAQS